VNGEMARGAYTTGLTDRKPHVAAKAPILSTKVQLYRSSPDSIGEARTPSTSKQVFSGSTGGVLLEFVAASAGHVHCYVFITYQSAVVRTGTEHEGARLFEGRPSDPLPILWGLGNLEERRPG
jgi:hypothetical protein